MPLPFNKSLDLKLLKLVKDNPILYNPKHNNYLDFDCREVVWQKIGDTLSRPAPACKSRWVNIRDMMRRRIRERLKNPDRKYSYKYEEQLDFMIPYFKESRRSSNMEFVEYLEDEATCSIEMPTEDFVDDAADFDNRERDLKPNISNYRSKKTQEDSCRDFSNETVSQELNAADPLDVFLITIGSTLRKFSPYYLNQAKSKIFQVVQDYELQQIVNKDDQILGSAESLR